MPLKKIIPIVVTIAVVVIVGVVLGVSYLKSTISNGIVEVERRGVEAAASNALKEQKQIQALEELQQKIKVLLAPIQQQSIKSPETASSMQIKNTCPIIAEDFKETNPESNNNDEEIFKLLKERKELMVGLMRQQPEKALSFLFSPLERETVQSITANCVEVPNVFEGILNIIVADKIDGREEFLYYLTMPEDKHVRIFPVLGEIPSLIKFSPEESTPFLTVQQNSKIKVKGFQIDNSVLFDGWAIIDQMEKVPKEANATGFKMIEEPKKIDNVSATESRAAATVRRVYLTSVNFDIYNDGYPSVRNPVGYSPGGVYANFADTENFYAENSYGKLDLQRGYFTINQSSFNIYQTCDVHEIAEKVINKIYEQSLIPLDYLNSASLVIVVPGTLYKKPYEETYECGYLGASSIGYRRFFIGGRDIYISYSIIKDNYYTPFIRAHEFGHQLGTGHANFLKQNINEITNQYQFAFNEMEREDLYDVMGGGMFAEQGGYQPNGKEYFNAARKHQVGFLGGSEIKTFYMGKIGSQIFDLEEITNQGSGVKALMFPGPAYLNPSGSIIWQPFYYVEYRRGIGVLLHVRNDYASPGITDLLDPLHSYAVQNHLYSAIGIGSPFLIRSLLFNFYDIATVSVLSMNDNEAKIQITDPGISPIPQALNLTILPQPKLKNQQDQDPSSQKINEMQEKSSDTANSAINLSGEVNLKIEKSAKSGIINKIGIYYDDINKKENLLATIVTLPSTVKIQAIQIANGPHFLQAVGFGDDNMTKIAAVSNQVSVNVDSRYPSAEFKTPGTYTFSVPSGVNNVLVSITGGGGGGEASHGDEGGDGGGGAAAYRKNNISITPNTNITVVVGKGGEKQTTEGATVVSLGDNSSFGDFIAKGGGSPDMTERHKGGVAGGPGGADGKNGTTVWKGDGAGGAGGDTLFGAGGAEGKNGTGYGSGGGGGGAQRASGGGASGYVLVEWISPNLPVANFTALPISGESPLNVQFADTSTYKPISWIWDFGDGATSTEQNPAHIYVNSGTFTVSLVVRNSLDTDTETKTNYITIYNAIPPTVLITSHNSRDAVSGTATLSASAADNVGVAGVQFKLDSLDLGKEDITAPYSISWDTTATKNGRHTLTAVARDASGNASTSPPVMVIVKNFPPLFITASPNPCLLSENEIYCGTTVTWSSKFKSACVYAYDHESDQEKLVACDGADVHSVSVSGISQKGTTFKLHQTKNLKSKIWAEVFVKGVVKIPAEITFSKTCNNFTFAIGGETGSRVENLVDTLDEKGRIIKTTGNVSYDNSGHYYEVSIDVTWSFFCISNISGTAYMGRME